MRVIKWIVAVMLAPFVFVFVFQMASHDPSKRLLALASSGSNASAPAAWPQPQWNYSAINDSISKSPGRQASIASTNGFALSSPYAGLQHALLTVREHPRFGKDVIVQIERGQLLCGVSGCSVPVRFDDGGTQRFHAAESADNDSKVLFLTDYGKFMRELSKAKVVRIEPTFYQHGNITLEFGASNFSTARYAAAGKISSGAPLEHVRKHMLDKHVRENHASATMRDDLKQARIDAKLTQEELAARVGKDQGAISRYESGKLAPDVQVAPLLAEALRIPLLQVLYGRKYAEPAKKAA